MNNLFYYTGLGLWIVTLFGLLVKSFMFLLGFLRYKPWFNWIKNWFTLLYYVFYQYFLDKKRLEIYIITLQKYLMPYNQYSIKITLWVFKRRLNLINNKR